MLYREIIAVCSQIQTNYINTLCGQKVEFFNVNPHISKATNRDIGGSVYEPVERERERDKQRYVRVYRNSTRQMLKAV